MRHSKLVCIPFLTCLFTLGLAWAGEPYPFKTKPREDNKDEVLRIDFEGQLPPGMQLGKKAKVEAGKGANGSSALVSSGQGLILKAPINKLGLGMSRFDVTLDFAGEGFALFQVALIPYGKDAKPLAGKRTVVGAEWGFVPTIQTWERRVVDLEFEGVHAVELEITQTNATGSVRLDNIVVNHYDTPVVLGSTARGRLRQDIKEERAELNEQTDAWVAELKGRQSFFSITSIDPNRHYLNSPWRERLHIGSTFKEQTGKFPNWLLGVSADQAALEAAATTQKKTLAELYEVFLNDVAEHGFNAVWVNFTKELEKFDELAAARGIHVIIQDPSWSGLGAWWSKPDEPAPESARQSAEANLKRYAGLPSVIGVDMHPSLDTARQPMLARARELYQSLAPQLQLGGEFGDVYGAENIAEPYPAFGIQWAAFDHYAGKPWVEPSYMFHPNYWPRYLAEGWIRRIHNGLMVHAVPNLWAVPSGKAFGKKSIAMQKDRVVTATTNWVYDDATQMWSGWSRYKYPPRLLSALVWASLQSGANGILVRAWGPAAVPPGVTGTQLLAGDTYAPGSYEPDLLRRGDMSESDGWKELGEVGHTLARYGALLAESTPHGRNIARSDKNDVRVKTLTGRKDPFKVVLAVNTKIGDYTDAQAGTLKIHKDTGELVGFKPAANMAFRLTVEDERSLFDLATGAPLVGTSAKDKSMTYELSLAPGEGRLYYVGTPTLFRRFVTQYKLDLDVAAAAKAKTAEPASVRPKTKAKAKAKGK